MFTFFRFLRHHVRLTLPLFALVLAFNSGAPRRAADPTFHFMVIHDFAGTDGANPVGQMSSDQFGTYYGVTAAGGAFGAGVVYKTDSNGVEAVLHSFNGTSDGAQLNGGLAVDTARNLYGTAARGGSSNQGVVFRVDQSGAETVLYSFTGGADGGQPHASPILDASGNLFGTASRGGRFGHGIVYKIDTSNRQSVLYSFTGGSDGGTPNGVLLLDASGNLFGTTTAGGANSRGVVFELTPGGQLAILHSFTGGSDGGSPQGGVVADSAGSLFGTAPLGGRQNNGVVYQIIGGVFSVLHTFNNLGDGRTPSPDLTIETTGRLYGAAQGVHTCGAATCGLVFFLTPAGELVPLHDFLGSDGSAPTDLLRREVRDFGVTTGGGANGLGVIYKINNLP